MSQLHIFVSAVRCSCQHSKPCRVCARLISQIKFISALFIYYNIKHINKMCWQNYVSANDLQEFNHLSQEACYELS